MAPNERFVDELIGQLVRTAIGLKREARFVPGVAGVSPETEILGEILTEYFKGSGRKIAETACAAFGSAGLTVEALGFSELWLKIHPDQSDLWYPEDDGLNGNHEDS